LEWYFNEKSAQEHAFLRELLAHEWGVVIETPFIVLSLGNVSAWTTCKNKAEEKMAAE